MLKANEDVHVMNDIVIGDIGGTNGRFARASNSADATFRSEKVLKNTQFESPVHAIEYYLKESRAGVPEMFALAVAAPIKNGEANFTNNLWQISIREIESHFGVPAILINDFEAVAHSIPLLVEEQQCIPVGPHALKNLNADSFSACAIGPGTGLGAAGIRKSNGVEIVFATEAGHSGFAPQSKLQTELHEVFLRTYDRVSNERLMSGGGLEEIYGALRLICAKPVVPLSSEEIFEHCRVKNDLEAVLAVSLFFRILGQVAGDLVLSMGAYDGVFLAGGILQKNLDLLSVSDFRLGFEHKGRNTMLMRTIPTMLIGHALPGLVGAKVAAQRHLKIS